MVVSDTWTFGNTSLPIPRIKTRHGNERSLLETLTILEKGGNLLLKYNMELSSRLSMI